MCLGACKARFALAFHCIADIIIRYACVCVCVFPRTPTRSLRISWGYVIVKRAQHCYEFHTNDERKRMICCTWACIHKRRRKLATYAVTHTQTGAPYITHIYTDTRPPYVRRFDVASWYMSGRCAAGFFWCRIKCARVRAVMIEIFCMCDLSRRRGALIGKCVQTD